MSPARKDPAGKDDAPPQPESTAADEQAEATQAPEPAAPADEAEVDTADEAELDTEAEADETDEDEAAEDDEDDEDEAVEEETAAAVTDAEPEPAKPARRRSATAEAEPAAKPRTRASRTVAKPKRKAAEAAFGIVDADLPAEIFDAKVNVPLIHQVVVAQQGAARQGTHSTKTRGEVRGGGRKPYRQKGTGRARQGSVRAPQFAGGGTVHGPVPRSYAQKTPKKMKAAALRGALSDRARHGLVQVVEGFVDGAEPKTRDAIAVLNLANGNEPGRNVLVVVETSDHVTWKSLRNATGVHLIDPGQLNTYDVLVSDRVVFTSSALASFVARAGAADREDAQR
jgi:large subunit ribosomal protein L4